MAKGFKVKSRRVYSSAIFSLIVVSAYNDDLLQKIITSCVLMLKLVCRLLVLSYLMPYVLWTTLRYMIKHVGYIVYEWGTTDRATSAGVVVAVVRL